MILYHSRANGVREGGGDDFILFKSQWGGRGGRG